MVMSRMVKIQVKKMGLQVLSTLQTLDRFTEKETTDMIIINHLSGRWASPSAVIV